MRKALIIILILVATGLFAADRPVKIWGYGNWFELSPKEWTGSKDMVTTFNEWLSKKFGFTVEYVGPVPKGQSWTQALAAYVGANGMPDVIIGGSQGATATSWSTEMTNAFLEFSRDKKLADLSKYFKDKKNYPVFYDADKEYLRSYMLDGKILALPGGNWHLKKDFPYSGTPNWIIRYDLTKKYGTPKTIPELTAFLRAVKADKPTDLDGKPVVPMVIPAPTDWPGAFTGILQQSHGAGFNITQSGKLMPYWGTEEFSQGLAYVNSLVREGLLETGVFSNDYAWLSTGLRRAHYAVGLGVGVAEYRDRALNPAMKAMADRNSDAAKELVSKQPVMLVPPVADKPGLLSNAVVPPTFIMKTCPNIDGVMKFAEFLHTFEGMVMFMAGGGFLNEGWEYVDYPDGPIYWQNKNKEPGNRDLNQTFPWGSVINALGVITNSNSASYYETMYYNKYVIYQRMTQWGIKVGSHNNDDATALEWSKDYASAVTPLATDLPSWAQFKYEAPQAELTANITVQQRMNEWMPKVVLAKTASEFIDLYGQMMKTLVDCADWKAIYLTKQKAYEVWLKAMRFDDRKTIKFNTPSRWLLDEMGWYAFPY
ncbi:MAG: hypothetical protein WC455_13490 [Dehalococcoidia bacterium]